MGSLIGKEIGTYRITKLIGRGGMAEVYIGIHTYLDRQVAIKVLHNPSFEEGGRLIERFKREAKAIAGLRHPNIVQIHDFDIQDDLIFMVMEYIDGTNLQKMLQQLDEEGKRFPTKGIGSIIDDVAKALDYAHSKGILHRDVKPSNILIDKEGKAYLTDFGIARIVGDQKLTATGILMGTPAYMSPEQGRGDELTEESDIYSLGIVAFEMLAGQVPYDSPTPIGIVHKQITAPIPDIRTLVEDIPGDIQEFIEKALAKAPDERFTSADQLALALRIGLKAWESAETSPRKNAQKTAGVDDAAFFSPTIEMQEETTGKGFDQYGAIPAEDEGLKQGESVDLPKKEKEAAQALSKVTKRKISLLGVIIAVFVLLGVAAIVLPRILDPSRPALPPPNEISLTATPTHITEILIVTLTVGHANGLTLQYGGDFDVEIVTVGENQEKAFRTGNGRSLPSYNNNSKVDYYMQLVILNDAMTGLANGRLVQIEIEYLDVGTDSFFIEYDAQSGGPYGNGQFMRTDLYQKTDTGEFKTAVFKMNDALFNHRINGGDFRISPDSAENGLIIRRVSVIIYP